MENKMVPRCAECSVKERACDVENGQSPAFCPTKNKSDVVEQANREYGKEDIGKFAKMASIQEGQCYSNRHIKPYVSHPVKPRVQEICEFAKKMDYRKLGIAFCEGLKQEARILSNILKAQGFDVVSVVCKVGCTPKELLGIKEEEKILIGEFESMCSPIAQAMVLNDADTDFNIVLGLCVGHDSLFFKYSKAPVTVLVAKDRVLGHNPVAALYTTSSYYARLMRPGIDPKKEYSTPSPPEEESVC